MGRYANTTFKVRYKNAVDSVVNNFSKYSSHDVAIFIDVSKTLYLYVPNISKQPFV